MRPRRHSSFAPTVSKTSALGPLWEVGIKMSVPLSPSHSSLTVSLSIRSPPNVEDLVQWTVGGGDRKISCFVRHRLRVQWCLRTEVGLGLRRTSRSGRGQERKRKNNIRKKKVGLELESNQTPLFHSQDLPSSLPLL